MHSAADYLPHVLFAVVALTPLCLWAWSTAYRRGFRAGILRALFIKDDQAVYDFLKELSETTGVYPYPTRIKVTIE
jgi:hypothetical protein